MGGGELRGSLLLLKYSKVPSPPPTSAETATMAPLFPPLLLFLPLRRAGTMVHVCLCVLASRVAQVKVRVNQGSRQMFTNDSEMVSFGNFSMGPNFKNLTHLTFNFYLSLELET